MAYPKKIGSLEMEPWKAGQPGQKTLWKFYHTASSGDQK